MRRPSLILLAACCLAVALALFALPIASKSDASGAEPTPPIASGSTATRELLEPERGAHPPRDPAATVASGAYRPDFPGPGAPSAAPPVPTPGLLRGRVVRDEDGEPIAGVLVDASLADAGQPTESFAAGPAVSWATTNAAGEFGCLIPADGRWTVQASTLGRDPVTRDVLVRERTPEEFVELRMSSLRVLAVRLVDARGAPASAAALGLDPLFEDRVRVVLAERCVAPGAVVPTSSLLPLRARAAGTFAWTVEAAGAAGRCLCVALGDAVIAAHLLTRGETEVALRIDAADVALAMGSCAIEAVDERTGTPVAGGTVRMILPGGVALERVLDAAGRASIRSCPRGEARIEVLADGFAPGERRVAVPGDAVHVIRLQPARRLAGVVLDASGAPAARVQVYLRRPESADPLRSAISDASGAFEFQRLAPGDYVVGFRGSAGSHQRGPTPASEQPVSLRGADVEGLVLRF